MPYFANLLPEGHMRTYLAEQAGVNPAREFFLLWALVT
jgi:serine/threonine-protein kinase HipA